ncbi:MAG: hypothetical protein M1820_006464 [Bogoriella megaspora]|nr:MAG: hypothetical protein M1820_006464 [Bogoriella megaspora]
MSRRKPRVLLFDIGGVCVVSPFQAILDYEASHSIPRGWINYAISKSSPNGSWQRLECGEIPLDAQFFASYKSDLENPSHWQTYTHQLRQKNPTASPISSHPPSINAEELFWLMMGISRTPDPYMYPALQKLHASRQFTLGALSNTVIFPEGHPYNSRTSSREDLRTYFDVFISSAHVGLRKPDPRIYELALGRLRERVREREGKGAGDLRAEEVVFLDDIGENLKAARSAGMRTVKVLLGRSKEAVRELEKITGLELLEDDEASAKL